VVSRPGRVCGRPLQLVNEPQWMRLRQQIEQQLIIDDESIRHYGVAISGSPATMFTTIRSYSPLECQAAMTPRSAGLAGSSDRPVTGLRASAALRGVGWVPWVAGDAARFVHACAALGAGGADVDWLRRPSQRGIPRVRDACRGVELYSSRSPAVTSSGANRSRSGTSTGSQRGHQAPMPTTV